MGLAVILKENYKMINLKKIFHKLEGNLVYILFAIFMTFPSFATLQKGESYITNGQFNQAVEVLSPYAEKNNPHALYLLGCIYLNSKSTLYNYKLGFYLLEKAVHFNYQPAIDELAGLYLAGEGVDKNEKKALHYYIQAAHLGYGPSQFNCGIMYKLGLGTEKDAMKAYLYLSLASLNVKDLDDLTLDAAKYRDELVPLLTPEQRQIVLSQVNALTLPENSRDVAGVNP
jgi:TPR repeat protein